MRVRVLGSGAGGGFPQWNCNCTHCAGMRKGTIRARARTQSSIAVSADGTDWVLFNCSPDIRAQLEAFPAMQPARAVRDTAIAAIVLIDSQIDHTTGLLMLREGRPGPLELYCTEMVQQDLTTGFPVLALLRHYCGVNHHRIELDGASFRIPGAEPLEFTAVPLRSQAPPYSPHRGDPHPGDTIGVRIGDPASGRNLFYAPGLGESGAAVREYLQDADCLLVDGTFWREDEMAHAGIGEKTAAEMGHLPQSGPGGMIELLSALPRPRKILIHINNTNPILDEDSPERAALTAAGIEVAYDGMEIEL
jgi:pyrroloquinoline quinone biosynthesis protein B